MRFLLTESEALFLKNKFGFSKLLGLNEKQRIKLGTEKALVKKNIICNYNGQDELHTSYRALFSQWEKMRYSITRPELNDKQHLQCILSNDKVCIIFVRKNNDITIDLFDFSEERMDEMIREFAELPKIEKTEMRFNLTLTLDEYENFIVCTKYEDFCLWQRKLGINAALLQEYVSEINSKEKASMLLVEDHIGDCGYMSKLASNNEAIYLVKHITHGKNQKMVVAMGETQYIVDSIYNF